MNRTARPLHRTFAAEVLKLRTVRSTKAIVAAGVGLTGLDAALIASQTGSGKLAPLNTGLGLREVITTTGFALLLSWVAGVVISTGEFRHHSATRTYLGVPQRGKVLAAKAVTGGLLGAAIGAIGSAVATGVGLAFVASRSDHVGLSAATIVGDIAGATVAAALLAVLGVALGYLVRAQLPVVVGVLLWSFLGESMLTNAAPGAAPYLPFTAATTLAGAHLGSGGFGFPNFFSGALPALGATALVAGLAALVIALATRTALRADVA